MERRRPSLGHVDGHAQGPQVDTEGSIEDFRRYDISGDPALRLAAHCSGHYSSTDHVFSALACRAPVGDGEIALNGSVAPMPGTYDLTMLARSLPVQPLVEFVRRVKKNCPLTSSPPARWTRASACDANPARAGWTPSGRAAAKSWL